MRRCRYTPCVLDDGHEGPHVPPALHLTPDDLADAPDELQECGSCGAAPGQECVASCPTNVSPAPEVRQVDRAFVLALAANLDAMRSMIDASLVVIDGILGDVEESPVEVASSDVTGEHDDECPHPRPRRQSLNTIGSGDDTPRWRCRDCGHIHNPPRRD